MALEWEEVTVGDLAAPMRNSLVGGPFGSNLVSSDYVPRGIPVIRGQNMGMRWVGGEFVYVSPEKALQLSANTARPGDLVFTQRGTLGQVALIPDEPYETYIVSQSQMKVTVDPDRADALFLYYCFSAPDQKELITRHAIQTGVPHTNLGLLRDMVVRLPPLAVQRAIAGILGALDDKIELNRRMNETLEAMARALFTSWFIDFDSVRAKAEGRQPAGMDAETAALFPDGFEESELGPIPRGWEVRSLDSIALFLNGLALQKYPPVDDDDWLPAIKIAELRNGNTEGSDRAGSYIAPQYIVEDGDVLFSWSGSLEVVVWCGGRGALNQHLFKVTSSGFPMWLVYQWIRYHLPEFRAIAADKATTMGHIQRHHLTDALVVVPPSVWIDSMNKAMQPLLDQAVNNNLESRTLAAIRDALLPKLLSGEVRVREAEKLVEAAI